MKKNCLSLIATLMISVGGFANTIEKEETKELEQSSTTDDKKVLEICWETSRKIVSYTEYFVTVEITYTCYNHPEIPGKGTVYIND
ncbi:hypothetical protein [Flavobacterium sp.]|uniref:hypothetical protein n=1 Tax=Flavobacterium sp. TaxID=239 RepID=UPI0022C002D8|nr:hypothetical protein [Flavobacterium sp.]MCZ8090733.1 hypothetical protein [Flavobacterium sp.]